jgi:large subunit ribosomal protein L24
MAARRKQNSARPARRPVMRVRSGDEVQIISGKDRGKRGKILRVEPAKQRVYVEGLNMVKRHLRPQAGAAQGERAVGGVIEREGPVHVSNVMLIDPQAGKPTRVAVRRQDGRRQRVTKLTGTELD